MNDEKKSEEIRSFCKRIDFYWHFIAVYSIALIAMAIIKGTIEGGTLSITLSDPVVILCAGFILFAFVGLLYNLYMDKKIIAGPDYIIFKNRIREKKYLQQDIIKIGFSKERKRNVDGKAGFKVIKMKVSNRRRIITIRPSSYREPKELARYIAYLKKNLKA